MKKDPKVDEPMDLATLQNNAERVEMGQYFVPFNPDELALSQEQFTATSIEASRMIDEFKLLRDDFKAKLKKVEAERVALLQNLKQKGEWRDGQMYLLADQETKQMLYFSADGRLVNSRRLLPAEQIELKLHHRTGTN